MPVDEKNSAPPSRHIAPFSTGSRLVATELKAHLVIHLVSMASGEIMAFSKPQVVDLAATVSQVRGRAIRRENVNGYQEVLLTCLAALGARQSSHTGIVGCKPPGSRSSLDAGLRREAACQTLAQHAVELAVRSDLLREVSPRALEAANLLRSTLFAVAPKHPFAATLVNWGHSHFFDIAAFASFDESALNSYSIFSLVVYDAITAVAQERPLEISDSELANLGWDTDPWAAAPSFYALLLDPDAAEKNKKLHRLRAGATLLRALAQHQSLGDFPNPDHTLPAFRKLWALSDEHLTSSLAVGPSFEEYGSGLDPNIMIVPMFVEAVVAKLASRQCRERQDPSARDVLVLAKQRYLACLKMFLFWLQPLSLSVDLHNRALLSLEQLPGWLEVTLEGASQFEKGEGELSSAGFGFDDLCRLLRLLESVATISARSEPHRVDLEKAMVALGVPTATPSSTPLDGSLPFPSEFTSSLLPSRLSAAGACLAGDLVQKALEDLSA